MSELLEASFVGAGVQPFKDYYYDFVNSLTIPDRTTEDLEARVEAYTTFLLDPNVMPRARRQAVLLLGRTSFELMWRNQQI